MGLILGQGIKIPHATHQKKREREREISMIMLWVKE